MRPDGGWVVFQTHHRALGPRTPPVGTPAAYLTPPGVGVAARKVEEDPVRASGGPATVCAARPPPLPRPRHGYRVRASSARGPASRFVSRLATPTPHRTAEFTRGLQHPPPPHCQGRAGFPSHCPSLAQGSGLTNPSAVTAIASACPQGARRWPTDGGSVAPGAILLCRPVVLGGGATASTQRRLGSLGGASERSGSRSLTQGVGTHR